MDLLRGLGTKGVMDSHDLYVAPPAVETILQEPGTDTNPDWAGMVRRSATQAP